MSHHGLTQDLYIDSSLRVSGTHTNFVYNFDIPENNFDRVALKEASIPKSYYNFPAGRNTFILRENAVDTTISIIAADYGVSSLIANLIPILNANSPNGFVYSATFPSVLEPMTGKITFSVSGNGLIQPSFVFQNYCYLQLGFEPNSINTFSGDTLVSSNYVQLSSINRVFIKSDICTQATNGILQEILQSFPDSSYIYYKNVNIESNSKEFVGSSSKTFTFTITDRFGIPIDTNGLNVIFTIILYKKDDTTEIQKQELQINNLERMIKLQEELNKISTHKPNDNPITPQSSAFNKSNNFIPGRSIN